METLGKPQIDPEVIKNLVFYFMWSIHLISKGCPESVATTTLNSYIDDLKTHVRGFTHPEHLANHLQEAYSRIPSSFLEAHEIPSHLGDGIRTIDVNYSWVKKL
jgi:hypothetical protein